MFGQMTAGSWIYIGTQGILQGTYETLRRLRPTANFGGTLKGRNAGLSPPVWAGWAAPNRWPSVMNEGVVPGCAEADRVAHRLRRLRNALRRREDRTGHRQRPSRPRSLPVEGRGRRQVHRRVFANATSSCSTG